jgi:hypothetical protein
MQTWNGEPKPRMVPERTRKTILDRAELSTSRVLGRRSEVKVQYHQFAFIELWPQELRESPAAPSERIQRRL